MRSVYTRAYKSRILYTSESASSLEAYAVCPSCHRNSRVRMNGVGLLNSHRTTLVHWFSLRGRSLQLRIHCTGGELLGRELGMLAIGKASESGCVAMKALKKQMSVSKGKIFVCSSVYSLLGSAHSLQLISFARVAFAPLPVHSRGT